MGKAWRRRLRAAGAQATGRPAATTVEWANIRETVLARSGWRCQACYRRRRLEVHHIIKRAQGGSDFDLDWLVALCRTCHAQTDAPYAKGRLVVTAIGDGRFTCVVVTAVSKWIAKGSSSG